MKHGAARAIPAAAPMRRPGVHGQRLVAVFLFGFLLFNYPLLYLFNINYRLFGIPLLYVYAFAAWGLLIALTAAVVERRPD